jgi:hypothetical protein
MYETRDGGHSFRARRVARPPGVQGVAAHESPNFFGRVGVLATRWERTGASRDRVDVVAFYRTSDGGRRWVLAAASGEAAAVGQGTWSGRLAQRWFCIDGGRLRLAGRHLG